MKMIAFYNNKGGVGKTSTAINIAYTLSRRENRVLLIDFDGQCNSSRFFTDLTNDEIGCERAIVCTDEKPLSNNAGASLNFALKILMLGFVFSIVYHGMAKFLNKIFGVVNNKNNENT